MSGIIAAYNSGGGVDRFDRGDRRWRACESMIASHHICGQCSNSRGQMEGRLDHGYLDFDIHTRDIRAQPELRRLHDLIDISIST